MFGCGLFVASAISVAPVSAQEASGPVASSSAGPRGGVAGLSFSRDIRPILSENCFACHGPDEKGRKAGLRLDEEANAKADHDGSTAVVPGKPGASALVERIESKDPDDIMPPPKAHKTIQPQQIALLKQWILQGAPWGKHWSYEPVKRPIVPSNGEANAVDAFLVERLGREKLSFSPESDKATLIRRVALDVTGLPPSLEELKSLSSSSQEAMVAHFMSKPAYGEHWAREWLDLARYADSAGYPSDPGREIWSYRDWVIRSLNANMPFDRFTIEQIAGDLLPKPTDDQLTATAFHRNTMTNNEGGTNDEEFRTVAVIDRVNTTFAVWMGTTMACAQCHTHKYDPITQKEYFQAYAFFNQSADADRKDEAPVLKLANLDTKGQREALTKEKTSIEAMLAHPQPEWVEGFDAWVASKPKIAPAFKAARSALSLPEEKRSTRQMEALQQYFVRHVSEGTAQQRDALTKLDSQLQGSGPVTVPIMHDLDEAQRRTTQIQLRGNWQALGDEVTEGVPAAFHPLAEGSPRNRLGLAQWLVSRDNPLTARVVMNRLWESVFGVGIVRSSEDFGSQGDMPVHPELLDWLAAEFMESGWDTKHMLALLLNSRAYRQVSSSTPALNERDPDNRLLARGPRFRPSGELLRDQALAVSGLLSGKMFGPPVHPLQPILGLKSAFGGKGGGDWETSEGEDRHRRSVYTEIRRSNPYPSFTTFDAPSREICTLRRGRSNTPLQAFVTLNDPVFIEAAQALGRRIVTESSGGVQERLRFVFQLCLSREPNAQDCATLTAMYDRALEIYRQDPGLATRMVSDPLGPVPEGLDVPSLAAWTVVANVVMNLDEFLMRR